MDHNGAIPEIRGALRISRQKQIRILSLKGLVGRHENGPMLPAQIAHLACLRLVGVAVWLIAAAVGVEVGAGFVAVSFVGDGVFVDVECYGLLVWQCCLCWAQNTYGKGRCLAIPRSLRGS